MIRSVEFLIATAIFISPAYADSIAGAIEKFGLIGASADDRAQRPEHTRQGFRMIAAELASGEPIYTTIDIDNRIKTTVRSQILSASLLAPRQLKLRLQILGGDVDGWPLPSPTTNTFEQTFERHPADIVRMAGNPPIRLQRCRD